MSHWLPAAPIALVLLAHVAALQRLSRRRDRWPWRRTLATLAGLATLAVALLPPLAARDEDLRIHVVQHLLITLFAPAMLALGAPVTLVLRAVRTPSRRRLLALLGSRPARLLTSPAIVIALDVGGMYAVYLTGLVEQAEHDGLLHALVHVHMIAAGFLFAELVVGPDPWPARPGVAGRLVVLVVAGAAHDVLAKLLYQRGWGNAAEIMYYGGEALDVALAVAVLAQWYAGTGRELSRAARRAGGGRGGGGAGVVPNNRARADGETMA